MTVGIIVCGHGQFATGIASTVELISGQPENFQVVDFNGSDDLNYLLHQAINKMHCEQLLFFTDILGGAPFHQASLIAKKRGNCQVVAGVTAQMLIEACLERDEYEDLPKAVDALIASARQGVTSLQQQMANKKSDKPSNQSSDDGI
ncbi:MAG: PTS mannose transporter subunit IIAB [Gammaproteobacteria bacterium]|nr:MAG: PTS mannose transporter subunit IIAB [Gammaproteobacteria bacterium]